VKTSIPSQSAIAVSAVSQFESVHNWPRVRPRIE
jgi:hypothetical protein